MIGNAKESPSAEVSRSAFELEIARYSFRLEALDRLILPRENKGNVLRGAFGTIFKRICCGPVCTRCADSPLRDVCAYAAIFEPAPPAGSDRLSNLQDIPRPFVFRPPLDLKTIYKPGELFEFELLLFGRARDFLPYFIVAFRELSDVGFAVGRARCRLNRVVAKGLNEFEQEVYCFETQRVTNKQLPLSASALMQRPASASKIRIDFLTPTEIKCDGTTVRSPAFHHLVKRARDRINALSWFYQGTLLDLDFADFGRRAQLIETTDITVSWVDRDRLSTRTRNRHSIGGFVGYAEYHGDLGEFIPLLRVAQFTHVGKHAVWGNGRIQLTVLP